MSISDAYPLATPDGTSIPMDIVRVHVLDKITFNNLTGTALNTALVVPDMAYVLYATEDCIVDFTTVASNTLNNNKAVLVLKGERAYVMLPIDATSFSVIGISTIGDLYVQQIVPWAGLANTTTMGNQ